MRAYAGARLKSACEIAGIDLRTLQRWQACDGLVSGDGRPQAVRATPGHALSEAERAHLLAVANEPRFAAVPPARIVPMLADEGIYLASESTFSRVLKAHGQTAHRGRAKPSSNFDVVIHARALSLNKPLGMICAGLSQLKSCPSKFGATGNAWVESVVALYFRPALARSPSARISFWMRLRLPL